MTALMISIRAIVTFTVLTGVLYPLAVTVVGKLLLSDKAEGSLVIQEGKVVGSELIGQSFSQERYFSPRPSAVKYDGLASGATNLGVTASDLIKAVKEREAQGAVGEMRYASGSGLDPHISVEGAKSQIERVAKARAVNQEELIRLVDASIEGRQFGFMGEKRVNVLLLNLAVDKQFGR